jgi:two-component system sensor histidine kinase DesK
MPPRAALTYLAVLCAGIVFESVALFNGNWFWMGVPMTVLIGSIGGVNVYQAQRYRHQITLWRAREDLDEMAKIAERERIARDLHDVLGHTLSVIALKSELASKLADRDPGRAIDEIRDVEQIARQALTDVRRAIEGYQQRGLSGELQNAARALNAAGIRLETQVAAVDLPPRLETTLALAVREAVTNVIRHARATRCTVRVQAGNAEVMLMVADDGRGGAVAEGNGLAGMRSRVAELGGTLQVDGSSGVRLTVRLPVAAAVAT